MYYIAVIDDNEAWCFTISLLLQEKGFAVSTFTDPYQFLRIADQFDLALVDFVIPARRHQQEIDGVELICQVKQQLEAPPLLILISSFFTKETLDVAHTLCPSADAHLSKGAGAEKILQQVEQLMATRSAALQPEHLSKP